jgi:RNA polymerase sigma-70 factor (sigma-E family)
MQPSVIVACSPDEVEKIEEPTDEARASIGDAREAVLRHHRRLVRLGVLLTGDAFLAEELAQETYLRGLAKAARLPEDEQYRYMRAIASNLWKNRLRRLALERRWSAARVEQPEASVVLEDRDALWRAIKALPVRQRACVVLRYYEELNERETAEVLGCSVGTVKSQTSRAIARLRKELDDEDRG